MDVFSSLGRQLYPISFIIVLCLSAACVQFKFGNSAADLVLEDLLAGDKPSRLKSSTSTPSRQEISYTLRGDQYAADLYLPADSIEAAIVIIPGLNRDGKDDLRLINLANTLTRSHFAVLIPNIPENLEFIISTDNIEFVKAAFQRLKNLQILSNVDRLGVGGISFGAGPAILIGLDPTLTNDIDFIVNIGGYYDLRNLIAFYTTGQLISAEPADYRQNRQIKAEQNLKWVFGLSFASLLQTPVDKETLEKYAKHVLSNQRNLHAPLPKNASPNSTALLALLDNKDPDKVYELIEKLPAKIRASITALNPAEQDLTKIKAKLLLIHGYNDHIIPAQESIMLAARFPKHQRQLSILRGLGHVEFKKREQDLPALVQAAEAILSIKF